MKYKVGDKVRVRIDLVVGRIYGAETFVSDMENLKGKQVTIKGFYDNKYLIEEDDAIWFWTDEMLSPVEETFNVGDVVYDDKGDKVTLLELAWVVRFENVKVGFRRFSQLRREKPLQKITRKELAEKGYVLVE